MTLYFDCAATSPIIPEAREALLHYTDLEFGNAGSRTHEFGAVAKRAVQTARGEIASLVDARPEEVIFTSGATEADNLAILGLKGHGISTGRRHLVTTAIEHKAVLEPVHALEAEGFEVTLVPPNQDGRVSAETIMGAVRPDTLLVSAMQVNNETGAIQPIGEIAAALNDHPAFFHVDAAQGFGKELGALRNPRVQLISISAHKIYGPKGAGALVARRGRERIPLQPLLFGGGQERGLRPGTLPVALIAAFGVAARAAARDHEQRKQQCLQIRKRIVQALEPVGAVINGAPQQSLASILNLSFPGLDSEAVMLALKDILAISNGSACNSSSYEPSHVLTAMKLSPERVDGALRFSWYHDSAEPDWEEVGRRVRLLQ